MNAETFAEFLERLGHKVVKTKSVYWYNAGPFSYLSFPFHYNVSPSSSELSIFWRKFKAVVVRYPTDRKGHPSYRVVCRNKNYDLSSLTSKARNQTRRGLENCKIRQIDFDFLSKEGLKIHIDTLIRQGRKIPKDLNKKWKNYCRLASETPGFDAWGAFVKEELIAYIIGFIMDGCYNIFIQRSKRSSLKYYPNNALVYQVTKNTLQRSDVDMISFGLESLQTELKGLVHFKLGMGFIKEPVKQRVEFNPLFYPVINFSSLLIYPIAKKYSDSEFWRKLKGVLEFGLDSR